jgi:hypothetical protein
MIRTGIEELLRKAPEPTYRMDMDLRRYIDKVIENVQLVTHKHALVCKYIFHL